MAPNLIILADLRQQDSATPQGADGALVMPGASAPGGLHVLAMSERAHAGLACDALFVAHGDITNRELIEAAAQSGKPLLLDTTGATLKEVERAVGWHQLAFRAAAVPPGGRIVLLHGVVGEAPLNLRALCAMQEHTMAATGLVDTGDGTAGALAVALGASVLLRAGEGMRDYAARVRQCEALLGARRKEPDGAEAAAVAAARKHIVAARNLAAGAVITRKDIAFASPAPNQGQLAPYQMEQLIGRPAKHAIKAGNAIRADDIGGEAPGEAQWFAPRPPRERPENV